MITRKQLWSCLLVTLMALLPLAASADNEKSFVIYSGPYYLAHHYNSETSQWILHGTTTFSEECLWYSDNVHNYFFYAGNVKHYLYADFGANKPLQHKSLSEVPGENLGNTDHGFYFYDWDFGLARGKKKSLANNEDCPTGWGNNNDCWEAYWLLYDGTTWKMSSAASYDSPAHYAQFRVVQVTNHPAEIVNSTGGLGTLSPFTMEYLESPLSSHSLATPFSTFIGSIIPSYINYKVCDIDCSGGYTNRICDTTKINHNIYDGADHLDEIPIAKNYILTQPAQRRWTLSGPGAAYLSFSDASQVTTSTIATPTLYYRTPNTTGNAEATLTLTITYSNGISQTTSTTVTVKTLCGAPAAWVEENTFYGLTLAWNATSEYGYTIRYRHHQDGEWNMEDEGTKTVSIMRSVPDPPASTIPPATRYTFTDLDPETEYDFQVGAICVENGEPGYPTSDKTVTVTTLRAALTHIGGSVFGGGRTADVNGNTTVIVSNCDTVSGVFGGNDIAGNVTGDGGSTIMIGVNDGQYDGNPNGVTNDTIRIGMVYGGGNGFYVYNGSSFSSATDGTRTAAIAPDGIVTTLKFSVNPPTWDSTIWTNGNSSTTLDIPTIKKSNITLKNNLVRVDSLFGGAKNAFITQGNETNTSITIDGGTVFAVFGGNNFGGTLASGSTQSITVNSTTQGIEYKTVWNESRERYQGAWVGDAEGKNTFSSGFGRDYGIRYIFGGGNQVAAQNSSIAFYGGHVDTIFAGGNRASVASATVLVDCRTKGKIITNAVYAWEKGDNDLNDEETARYYVLNNNWSTTIADADLMSEYNNLESKMSKIRTDNGIDGTYPWNGKSFYNIRTLFGGNNNADMYVIPTLTLNSGAIGTVYGGGNAGAMKGRATTTIAGDGGIDYSTHVATTAKSTSLLVDNLYGGCQKADVDYSTWVEMGGGHVGTIYGGCNISGDVGSNKKFPGATSVANNGTDYYAVNGGTWVVANRGKVYNNIFAGSNGFYHCNDDFKYVAGIDYDDPEHLYIETPTTIPTHNETHVRIHDGITVYGNVYAGGNMASVGFPSRNAEYYANNGPWNKEGSHYPIDCGMSSVRMDGGLVTKNVFGGGNMASIYGCNDVQISGGEIRGALYGGNDRSGRVGEIDNRKSLPTTASDTKTPTGGETGAITTYVLVDGTAKIGTVYGGGNGDYDYTSNSDFKYCGDIQSIQPIQSGTFVDINIDGSDENHGHIGTVYGGGDGVTVQDRITVFFNVETAPNIASTFDNVDRIFGGNNKGDLDIVPDIILRQGKVHDIYGGCNQGNMKGSKTIEGYDNVGSYVHILKDYIVSGYEPDNVNLVVSGNVFGGCRLSDVSNNSLVLVEGGDGIKGGDLSKARIFGGNDISGKILGTAHVVVDKDADVKQIFGGGNGAYTYNTSGHITLGGEIVATGMYERPYCDSTEVKLLGGICDGNVYGGGLAGDCGSTHLLVEGTTVLKGKLFGGGCGDTTHIGISCADERLGNVTSRYGKSGTAHTDLISASTSSTTTHVYGGGHSGDCDNTDTKLYESFRHHLRYLYGGCRASNVFGTAKTVVDGFDNEVSITVDTVFGGNDYSGKVQNTMLTINSGRFITAFGAGNGDYDYTALNCYDTVPYSMDIDFTINGGTFIYSVYGGGFMGLVGNRDMIANEMSEYKNDNDNGSSVYNSDRFDNIGHITMNIHGGRFERHIFAGACGRPGMRGLYFGSRNYTDSRTPSTVGSPKNVDGEVMGHQLVYGTKVLNMDGGYVRFSVYGGSESVDDGFPYECIGRLKPNLYTGFPHWKKIYLVEDASNPNNRIATDVQPSGTVGTDYYEYDQTVDSNTTLWPSSVVNIVGGVVEKSVYGGGYQGNIFGSVFVNIGSDAVDDSPVWTRTFGSDTPPMAKYKPELTKSTLMLNASVYNASDWGDAGDTAYFTTRGVFGGITNILIDGKGYRTGLSPTQTILPQMNIAYSIIGSGTSTEGGDINRLITMRHYGDYYSCPNISKTLASIQRADKVVLDSVFIQLDGEQDAFSAYPTPNYTFCRIDTLIFSRDNIVHITFPSIYIGRLVSMRDGNEVNDLNLVTNGDVSTLVDRNKLYTNFMKANSTGNANDFDRDGNTISNDLFDNLQNYNRTGASNPYNVDENGCGTQHDGRWSHCEELSQCQRLPSERGRAGQMGAYNTLVLSNGSYVEVSPYIDMKNKNNQWMWDNNKHVLGRDGRDDDGHKWGHVHGWMYLVTYDETMNYVYADTKITTGEGAPVNVTDGGFVSTCDCDNIWVHGVPSSSLKEHDAWELNYVHIPAGNNVPQPYRIWKIGKNHGTRKRHITLVANAKPDHILNEDVNTSQGDKYYPLQYPQVNDVNCTQGQGSNTLVTTTNANHNLPNTVPDNTTLNDAWLNSQGYTVGHANNISQYSYATTTLELPPSNNGNFYIMTAPVIDLDNGGQITLTDQAYVYKPGDAPDVIFQTSDLYQKDNSGNYIRNTDGTLQYKSTSTPMEAIIDNPNYTFGLAFTTDYIGSNFSTNSTPWMSSNSHLSDINNAVNQNFTGREIKSCHLDWPTSYISGNEYLTQAGGFVSKEVVGAEGTIPYMTFTLTYNRNINTTITRDVTFTLEEYTSTGEYVGPVEVTVTINTVIKDLGDLDADLLAMYNEGVTNEYVRKISIPACYVQRDIVLEGIEWDIHPNLDDNDKPKARYMFNLQDTTTAIENNRQFSLIFSPTEFTSDNLTTHLGWYNIQTRDVDLFNLARTDRLNNNGGYYTTKHAVYEAEETLTQAATFNKKNSNKYNSFDITNATGENPKIKSLMGSERSKGLLLGTIDGRSTASFDITLKFDGLRVYEDFFPTPPQGPLGVVKLHMHWYNTKVTPDDIANHAEVDGDFIITINLRTRKEGDTIYMAWGDVMRVEDNATDAGTDNMNVGKPRYWYLNSSSVETAVPYNETTGELTLPTGVTESDIHLRYHPYVQRYVDNDPTKIATVHSFEWQQTQPGQTGWDLVQNKEEIYDNPDAYLRTFEEAMKIYKEGDVIDIIQTIPIAKGTKNSQNAQAIGGLDYSSIQVIRYSGSHYKFPSLGCANYDPLVDVTSMLTMRNIWFNGSGFTRVKKPVTGKTVADVCGKKLWRPNTTPNNANNYAPRYTKDNETYYDHSDPTSPATVSSTNTAADGYYESGKRDRCLLPVHAPMIYIHDGGKVNFSVNVAMSNNVNLGEPVNLPEYLVQKTINEQDTLVLERYHYSTPTYTVYPSNTPQTLKNDDVKHAQIPGGAVAIIKDNSEVTPELSLGHRSNIYDNVVVDPAYSSTTTHANVTPNSNVVRNSGAGAYVYGGLLTIGSVNTTSTININHNYFVKINDRTSPLNEESVRDHAFSADTAHTGTWGASYEGAVNGLITNGKRSSVYTTEITSNGEGGFNANETESYVYTFFLDTIGGRAQNMSLNNVQLTRTYRNEIWPKRYVRLDRMSDVVNFRGLMTKSSKVGISKWFPGYVYNANGTARTNNYQLAQQTGSYFFGKYHQLWDSIPRDTISVARLTSNSTIVATYVYDSAVFFNDSVFFSQNTSDRNQAAFKMDNDNYKVLYAGNSSANPGFNDHVYTFHHDYLSPKNIYFQRCATFGKGIRQHLVTINEPDPLTGDMRPFFINDYMKGDSIAYWWNKDATCVASTDTIVFKVGGGFFPYTYHWDMDSIVYEKSSSLNNYEGTALRGSGTTSNALALKRVRVHDRVSYGGTEISDLSSPRYDKLRAMACIDTLVMSHLHMNQQLIKSTYLYQCTAYDLTGRCPVSQPVLVRVGKITSEGRTHKGDYYIDSTNFLRHRNPWAAYQNYKDESQAGDMRGFYTEQPVYNGGHYNGGEAEGHYTWSPTEAADEWTHYTERELNRDANGNTAASWNDRIYAENIYDAKYLYYRIPAPGVDSSSFHDNVPVVTVPDRLDNMKTVTAFINSRGDTLYPYIRPWFPNREANVDEIRSSERRDTLGYEIRVYNGQNVRRYRYHKVQETNTPTAGIYTKIGGPSYDDHTGWTPTTDRNSEDFLPVRHVPHHTHAAGEGTDDADRGIRRAGYSHVPMHWFNHGYNHGNLAQRVEANSFNGKPYHDINKSTEYGTDNVRYVTEKRSGDAIVLDDNDKPTWIDDDTPRDATIYNSEMVPRYLRVYRSYKITPQIMPENLAKSTAEGGEGAKVWAWETYETSMTESNKINLATAEFCPGGVVHLSAHHDDPTGSDDNYLNTNKSVNHNKWEYMAWDFDPSSQERTNFVVSADPNLNSPTVYYAPHDYWYQVVTNYEDELSLTDMNNIKAGTYSGPATSRVGTSAEEQKAFYARTAFDLGYYDATNVESGDFHQDYSGNVTIYTKKGLAWLISMVNGFNNQNARTFRFNTITLKLTEDGESTFDMGAHKWTPIGNPQNHFEGLIVGNDDNQVVKNIIINERSTPFVGMFGYTDHARIRNFKLQNAEIRSNMYVGGLIGQANDETEVSDMKVENNILFGEYVLGGIAAKASNSKLFSNQVLEPVMFGNAIYAGGGVGVIADGTNLRNNSVVWWLNGDHANDSLASNLSSIFNNFHGTNYGGIVGHIEDPTSNPNGASKDGTLSSINNNYVQIMTGSNNLRVGGLVGSAAGVNLNNNYVYGEAKSSEYIGGLIGYVGNNVNISNCYYVNGLTGDMLGSNDGGTTPSKSTTFHGKNQQVLTIDPIDGIDNLTRILNKWVDANSDSNEYFHWRSAISKENSGYPVFGTPDLIPVVDSAEVAACESFEFDGLTLTESGRYVFHVVDSSEYVDSTFTLLLTVNYGDSIALFDSVRLGEGYSGNGITISAEQIQTAFGSDLSLDVVAMRYVDSLMGINGCDSLVMLTLYILNENSAIDNSQLQTLSTQLKIYPNPTRGIVHVEGSDLRSVEVYDNISRRLLQFNDFHKGNDTEYQFDLSDKPAGAYYVRVRTAQGSVVKKIIKK